MGNAEGVGIAPSRKARNNYKSHYSAVKATMRSLLWLVGGIGRGVEIRTPDLLRPRQARYQAALRPDMKYVKIIKDFPTELLLHLTYSASNCAKTVPNRFH